MAEPIKYNAFLQQLPAFLELLRTRDILRDINDYEQVYRILQKVKDETRLKTHLAPILISSSEDQEIFYELFDAFFQPKQRPARIDFGIGLPIPSKENFKEEKQATLQSKSKSKSRETLEQETRLRYWLLVASIPLLAAFIIGSAGIDIGQGRGLIIISIASLLWLIIAIWMNPARRRQLVVRKVQSKEPPYFWKIDLDIKERIHFGAELPLLAQGLRRRLPGNIPHLNIQRTLQKTISQAGALSLQYKYRTRPAEYIFLIDNTNLANHQTHLFELLYRQLVKSDVYVERFYYKDDMRICWNEQHTNGISLAQIAMRYSDYRLLIFGDGWKMLNPTDGALMKWTEVFTHWTDRALLTPKPSGAWSYEELALSDRFVVLPSSLDGLLDIVAHFESLKEADLTFWRSKKEQVEIDLDHDQLLLSLQQHFTPELQTWVAACAIYPELSWDLTLYLGELLSAHFGHSPLSYTNIIQLAQLPWFKHGQIPDEAREQLIDLLPEDLRMHLHQALVDVLEEQYQKDRDQLLPTSHAYSTFKLQLAVHKLSSGNYQAEQKQLKKEVRTLIREGVKHDFIAIQSVQQISRLDTVLPAALRPLTYQTEQEKPWWERFIAGFNTATGKEEEPESKPLAEEPVEPPSGPTESIEVDDDFKDTLDEQKEEPEELSLYEMVQITGGVFTMGTEDAEARDSEKPVHQVKIKDYQIGKYPLTVKEYLHFVSTTDSNPPEWMEEGNEYNAKTGTDDHYKKLGDALTQPDCPIVGISWYNAIAYCNWLSQQHGLEPVYDQKGEKVITHKEANGYRLPTEAEWEYAARGGQKRQGYTYSGSDKLDDVGWYVENANRKTHPIGQKMPNELGLYDMSGNVWEWCEDDWHGNYEGAPADGSAWIDTPERGSDRVPRGGGWGSHAGYCRVTYRDGGSPTFRYSHTGFRLVSSLS